MKKEDPKILTYYDPMVGAELKYELPWDYGMEDLIECFKGIAKVATFAECTIDKYLTEYNSEDY